MIELLLVGAMAQVQTIKLPPVAIPRPAPSVSAPVEMASPGKVAIKILPDLVVKDIRADGETSLHVLVANEGTADAAGEFRVTADVYAKDKQGKPKAVWLSGLKMGETRWVEMSPVAVKVGGFMPGGDPFPVDKAERISATVDQQVLNLGWNDPTRTSNPWGGSSLKCTEPFGCIRELNDANNSLIVEGSAISRAKPE